MFRALHFARKSFGFRKALTQSFSFHRSVAALSKLETMASKKNLHILQNETPIVELDCSDAFRNLTEKEKKYAHYIARASAEGSLACFLQCSPESASTFGVLYSVFANESVDEIKQRALAAGWTEDDFTAFLVYVAGFYANCGNYKSFGDSKFIPNVEKDKLSKLLEESKAFANNSKLSAAWKKVVDRIFSLDDNHLNLGFADKGVTGYISANITKEDALFVDNYFKSKNMEAWNTRLIKDEENGKKVYTIISAAAEEATIVEEEFEGARFIIKSGDYSPIMKKLAKELEKAIEFTANDNEKQMLQKYVEHFKKGNLDAHKDGSRFWIKNVNPAVETYIGFIENYRDPAGTRAEFEGFVAAVNKTTSKKFQSLVAQAEEILKLLPWGADYEKDAFLKPDFTALDVIYFGSSGIPAGINIPNYDDIRQNEGFKNVSLGNVISAMPKQKIEFLSEEDEIIFKKYFKESFEVQVGLHELLGHGSGKLFQFDGEKLNFDKTKVKDILTGEPISMWYDKGETWSSKFGALSNPYEECRAEAVGYYLSTFPDILKIFGFEGDVAQDIKYANWMNEIRAGLVSLEFYNPDLKKWGQAHSMARYVLLRVAMAAGQGFVTIEETTSDDGKPDLKFKLDRSKIDTVGRQCIGDFLKLLQAYKSTGNFAEGSKMFKEWAEVGPEQIRWRDVVIARRKPRRCFVQPNTILCGDTVELKTYQCEPAGVIQSFLDRHSAESVNDLLELGEKEAKTFGL